ncbi:hypothetical protein [Solihabitans fulvus]|nr:hypothetical protein [Solihabitans fulvus]
MAAEARAQLTRPAGAGALRQEEAAAKHLAQQELRERQEEPAEPEGPVA